MKVPRACGFLIVKGDPIEKFLLMKHSNRWDLPKGHVDPGETDIECALRELVEETGICAEDLQIDESFFYETQYLVKAKRYSGEPGEVEKTLRIFLGRLTSDVKIVVSEHEGYKWFNWKPPHNIQKKAIDPILERVADFLAPTSIHMPIPDGDKR